MLHLTQASTQTVSIEDSPPPTYQNQPIDGQWYACVPLLPRWVEGRFRRKNLQRRLYLIGGHECDLYISWRVTPTA